MSFGDRVFDAAMYTLEIAALRKRRRALIPRARGRVLEIGAGTGANLPFYRWDGLQELHLLDLELPDLPRRLKGRAGAPLVLHRADAQQLPFGDGAFDTVVFTLVFCSVADPHRGLAEARRVLKPGGLLLFVEHVRPLPGGLARVVDAANPLWRAINGQCNLNRDTLAAIDAAGFDLLEVRRRWWGLLVDGVAVPRLERAPGASPLVFELARRADRA